VYSTSTSQSTGQFSRGRSDTTSPWIGMRLTQRLQGARPRAGLPRRTDDVNRAIRA
jgi:hypothetical protein